MERENVLAAVALTGILTFSVVLSPLTSISIPTLAWFALSGVLVVGSGVAWLQGKKRTAEVGGFAFFVIGLAWWAPVWQKIVYALLVKNPGGIQWFVIGVLVFVGIGISGKAFREDDSEYSNDTDLTSLGYVGLGFLIFGVIGLVLIGPVVSGLYAHEDMAGDVQENAIEREAPPETVADRSRIAPRGVSENWARNSLQYPRYNLEGGDITYIDGTPHWSYSLSPDGTYNTLTRSQIGAVYVNQSSMTKDITVHDDETFRYGQGVGITDSYAWQMKQRDYLKDYGETFVVPYDGKSYLAVPYTTYDWEFRMTPVPQMYAVPQFGGVKIIDTDGEFEDVPASEVEQHPILDGQNYYPYELARFKVKSMAYKNGIVNTWFGHEEQIELADVPGDGNQQPFAIPTEDGPAYIVAVEPWGDANGIYQVWTIDAQTGEMEYTQFDQQDALRGPRKAVDSIMGQPQLSRLNNVQAVEPIPVVRDETLYWQVRVIPDSSARVTYVAFFNADTEEVTVVETTNDVRAFLSADQEVQGVDIGDENASDDAQNDSCDFHITIQYEDGTTETTCVTDGATVTIDSSSNETDTSGDNEG